MCENKRHFKLAIAKPIFIPTEFSWSCVQLMKSKYLQNPDSLKIEKNTGIDILNGVRVNAEHWSKLHDRKSGNGVVIQNPAQDICINFHHCAPRPDLCRSND